MKKSLLIQYCVFVLASAINAQVSFSIGSSDTLAIDGNIHMVVSGNWENNGGFNPGSGMVEFTGLADQTISNPDGEEFNNLMVKKPAGVLLLANDVSVIDSLIMQSGNVSTGANTLALGTNAEGILEYTSGTIIGNFARFVETVTGIRLFPVGTVENYRPLTVDYTSAPSTSGVITVAHTGAGTAAEALAPPLDDDGYSVDRRSQLFWSADASGISSGVYSLSIDGDGQQEINTPGALRVIHSDDQNTFDLVGAHVSGSGTTANRSGISGNTFGFFYLGGNETDNPMGLGESISFSKSVAAGWNMVGLPALPGNRHYQSVFPSSLENTFFGFNGSYFNEDSFEVCGGYWLNFPAAETVGISGTAISSCVIDLAVGWNMISGISGDVALTDVLDPGSIINPGTLFRFQGGYTMADTIRQGEGYWINTNAAGQITLNLANKNALAALNVDGERAGTGEAGNRGRGDGRQSAEHRAREDLGAVRHAPGALQFSPTKLEQLAAFEKLQSTPLPTLKISDAEGRVQTLRFSINRAMPEAGVPEQQGLKGRTFYTLPPPAPEAVGALDARFSGDRHTIDEDEAVIELRASHYPVTINAENLSALMTTEAGVAEQYVLKEKIGEKEGASHLIRAGSEITITNPKVRQLILAKAASELPTEFRLHQNYPNPFNPATTIRFEIPEETRTYLNIYNMLGQRIRTLVNEIKQPGIYSVVWDGSAESGEVAATGIYIYQIKAGDFKQSKKLLLLR